jgi:O-6-methylguanine DNA methyltransferase
MTRLSSLPPGGLPPASPIEDRLPELALRPPGGLLDMVVTRWVTMPSAIGELYVAFTDRGVAYARPAASYEDSTAREGSTARFLEQCRAHLGRPLLRSRRPPAGLASALRTGRCAPSLLDLSCLAGLDRDALLAALLIPRGQTRPYAWVAKEIGRPHAIAAVAAALERNPMPVLVPCHRVIRSNGQLGGHVLGTAAKEQLLRHEGVDLDEAARLAGAGIFYLGSDTTHIVCYPVCHQARRITTVHRREFRSIQQAAQAGYRPCRTCRPGTQVAA